MGTVNFGLTGAFARATVLAAGLLFSFSATAQERVMIVMDGSGSMWGQIDGVPKLSIARETLREVLPGVPATTELGLLAYGHREKGNCSDIELIVAPATGTANAISSAVDNMRFLGKTPLSAAVQIAAEELRYTEDKATVILITDGIETCSADPCALGNSLEQQGIDFTAHVVGFGLSAEEGAQVSCLAENTGGRFFSADDGEGLLAALNEVVVAVVPQVTFVAVDQDGNQLTESLNWIVQSSGGKTIAQIDGSDKLTSEIAGGDYMVLVSGPDISGGMEFSLKGSGGSVTIQVPVEIAQLFATLQAPESVAAGAEFEVIWTGPNDESDYVTIVEVGAREGSYLNYAYTTHGSPGLVTAPDGLGIYELRYVHGPSDKTLATRSIELTPVMGSLEAPDSVAAGAKFDVIWTGPSNDGDYITIVEKGADEGNYGDYAYTQNGSPASISAPDALGVYEVRYVINASDRTLVARDITITAVSGTLEAPDSVGVGAEVDVVWTGPNNDGDFITVVEVGADEGTYIDYAYTGNGSPATITMPDRVGTFEIRYVINSSDRTLVSRTIDLTDVLGTLEAPESVAAGSEFEVTWSGPDNDNDYITIAEVGASEGDDLDYARTREGNVVKITAPDQVGTFEIRYVIYASDRTLVSKTIELTAVSGTLEVPESVAAGSEFNVTWTGPDNANDYITIAEVGAAEGDDLDYARTREGATVKITAPDAIGTYEVRYVVHASDRTLVSKTIELTAVSGTLEVTNTPVPGGKIEVSWTGPDNANDYITIAEAGAPEGTDMDYARTREGASVIINAPRALGNFEIRYVISGSDRTLVSIPITLAPASATLAASQSVSPGGVVQVKWTGPGNREDFIEIVPVGTAADESPLSDVRTSQGSPLSLFAPGSAGQYEVRYKMRDTGEVLASTNLTVE